MADDWDFQFQGLSHSNSQSNSQKPTPDPSQPATPIISFDDADAFPLHHAGGAFTSDHPYHQFQEPTLAGNIFANPGTSALPPRADTPGRGASSASPDSNNLNLPGAPPPAQIPSALNAPPSSALTAPPKVGTRFSSGSVRVLRAWFAHHERHPYPSPEDVEALQAQTGLSRQQITNWLANCRRRSKFSTSRPASPHVRGWAEPGASSSTPSGAPGSSAPGPMDIPARRATPAPTEHMNPMQRWENSPPEHEAATVSAISRAVAASVGSPSAAGAAGPGPGPRSRTSGGGRSGRSSGNASSVSSAGTSRSSRGSGSHASAYSHTSRTSLRSLDSLKQRGANRRRRRATTKRQESSRLSLFQATNTYQCTFCTETFKTKYDWQRHEKSLHLSLEEWVCSPRGSTEVHPDKPGPPLCVYCGEASPDQAHLNGHNDAACLERPFEERTFYRKDHLQQHLKLVHGTKYLKWPMENWKVATREIRSRCGFCGITLESWGVRADHLAEHFKGGRTMADWKGDWGFEASVIEMLDNAMPPYLIHYEQNSPLPFSAVNGPADTPTSAYELIKLELEYYMRNYYDAHGEPPPDDKMQYEGCSIIFGAEVISQDPSSSTPSWLRDIFMANADIARQARIRPMKQVAKSRMSQLKINGKRNIFENCELEGQVGRHIAMHDALGLALSDYDLQQEACNAIARVEVPSPNPSHRFVEFLTRLIWDSNEWLVPLRERGLLYAAKDTPGDEGPHPLDMVNLDPFTGQAFSADGQQPQQQQQQQQAFGGVFSPLGELPDLTAGLDIQMPSALTQGWTHTQPSLQHQQTFASGTSTPLLGGLPGGLPGTGTSSPSGLATPQAPSFPTTTSPPTVDPLLPNRWVPMPGSGYDPTYLNPGMRPTSVTPFFLNDNNSYRRLARELSRFVASCMSPNNPNSHVPTDDELKYQARWILYDDDDPWNQTPVDNIEWLTEFKRDVGLAVDDGQSAPAPFTDSATIHR
ncbi:hypothetical protein F5X68DRAFT_265665 [Plectosphaerella plurivora]|uniref:Uncharacterized protein n=1 Tax=Plectosphaerella plurivora TaxID=936078 RepID=A0A9P8V2J0_9PEZI|nr:hypothetical protein F5X68DRAFT_265665 [Plectosphaerella plurivora]